MVPFPLSRSPHPSSGPLPTYCKPARPAPLLGGAPHKGLQSGCGVLGFRGGGFLFCVPPPASARYNPFRFWRRGSSCAAAPAYHPAGSVPFTAALFRPPPPEKARRAAPLDALPLPDSFLPPGCCRSDIRGRVMLAQSNSARIRGSSCTAMSYPF
ncbi:hypothetical protein D7X33_14210 [Butyricicoccus sp. 1XD8-22]|nr:hypothetical protein D7X33_14210 [Butyricicoccus sp. 1XD8-22]